MLLLLVRRHCHSIFRSFAETLVILIGYFFFGGLCDVAEFCLYSGGHMVDPGGSLNGFKHTFRGGQIFAMHTFCQSAAGGGFAHGQIASPVVGFRIDVVENDH